MNKLQVSIVIPVYNEERVIKSVLESVIEVVQSMKWRSEIIVVNDGSTDDTENIVATFNVILINHRYCLGNGAAIKAGARKASGDILLFMDGDGQHQVLNIAALLSKWERS